MKAESWSRRRTRRECCLLALFGVASFTLARSTHAAPRARTIHFARLGPEPPAGAIDLARLAVTTFYDLDVHLAPRASLPRSAFYAPRGRYRAEKLLAALAAAKPRDAHRIVGLTAVDVSTTKPPHEDWGILGLADLGGPACVVSSYRCARGARGAGQVGERFAKVVVHELGHTFGLPHCEHDPSCLMVDGGGTVLTLDREHDLCERCRSKLASLGVTAGPAPAAFGASG